MSSNPLRLELQDASKLTSSFLLSLSPGRKVFFAASQKAWSVGVVEVLKTLEEDMVGVYALGDQVVSYAPRLFLPLALA